MTFGLPGLFPFALIGIKAGALIDNHVGQELPRAASNRTYRVHFDF